MTISNTRQAHSRQELVGQHHRLLCETVYAASDEYRLFWQQLAGGEYKSGRFKRRNKQGEALWLEASYNPIIGRGGKVTRVLKTASDITHKVTLEQEMRSRLEAIDRSMATVEFSLDGFILDANQNFLDTVGYSLEALKGAHHRQLCEADYAASAAYREFWKCLNTGEYMAGQFKRVTRTGEELWLEATYNPVFDANGTLYKVIKYATDITQRIRQQNAESESARIAYRISSDTEVTANSGAAIIESTVSANSPGCRDRATVIDTDR